MWVTRLHISKHTGGVLVNRENYTSGQIEEAGENRIDVDAGITRVRTDHYIDLW